MTNHFCGECGSLVYRTSSGYPGFALKVGNIDVSRVLSKVDTLVWSVGLAARLTRVTYCTWPFLLSTDLLRDDSKDRSHTDIDLHGRTAAKSIESTSLTSKSSLGAGRLGSCPSRVRRRQKWIFRKNFWQGTLGNVTAIQHELHPRLCFAVQS
jgi:hypothetical protein